MKLWRVLLCVILACAAVSRARAAYIGTPPLLVTPSNAAGQVVGSTIPGTPSIPLIVLPGLPFAPVPAPPVAVGKNALFPETIGRSLQMLTDGALTASLAQPFASAGAGQSSLVVSMTPNPSLQCPFISAVSTTATNKQIAGLPGKRLHICTIFLQVAGAENIGMQEGTGTTCGTGTTNLIGQGSSGSVAEAANSGFIAVSDRIILPMQVTGDDLCIVKSASNNVSGFITYGIY